MPCIEDIDYRFPTLPPTLPLLKIMPFTPLGLSPELLKALAERHYAQPTAIQTAAIPSILQGRDVRACAQTGSGKTAAFGLPLLHLLQQRMTTVLAKQGVLILVPTRELAAQVGGTLFALAAHFPKRPKICAVFGGVSINPQMMRLRGGADVVVATPGRLLDLVAHNAIELGSFATLVLDEADRLFDLGFAEELERILALLPAKRQNLFFSATFPPKVQALADTLLHDPVRIELPPDDALKPAITQRAFRVDADKRTRLLRHLIKEHAWSRVLVFVATKFAAEIVADKLRKDGINAEPFHWCAEPGQAYPGVARFQGFTRERGGGHRHGGARHRHCGAARGDELRPAPLCRGLCAPHWPHRPCRAGGAGGELYHGGRRGAFQID